MNEFFVAIGLVFVIEGLLWAVFPDYALRMLEVAAVTPPPTLRTIGTVAVGIGVLIVWLVLG